MLPSALKSLITIISPSIYTDLYPFCHLFSSNVLIFFLRVQYYTEISK